MKRAALLTLIVLVAGTQAANAVKIITPSQDSCLAYTNAMDTDSPLNAWLSGWAVGFFDGVAQGTGIDYLRNYDMPVSRYASMIPAVASLTHCFL
jgi:hypothetical protein